MSFSKTVPGKWSQACALYFCFFSPVLSTLTVVPLARAQTIQKVAEGKVVNSDDKPQPGAIVYLKNGKTNEIKSFISIADGTYRFGQLSPDIDYELWAEYQGRKSSVKAVSSFDSRQHLNYSLKVDTGK